MSRHNRERRAERARNKKPVTAEDIAQRAAEREHYRATHPGNFSPGWQQVWAGVRLGITQLSTSRIRG